jgi:hypothetical protein
VRCEECRCISEDARDWIAKLIDDDEELKATVSRRIRAEGHECEADVNSPEHGANQSADSTS